jgi:hypothetical protein
MDFSICQRVETEDVLYIKNGSYLAGYLLLHQAK